LKEDGGCSTVWCSSVVCAGWCFLTHKPVTTTQPNSEDEEDDISEDLDAAMRSLQALTTVKTGLLGSSSAGSGAAGKSPAAPAPGTVMRRPEVIDDFIR